MKAADVVTLLRRAQMTLTLSQADEEKELIQDINVMASFLDMEIEWTKKRPAFERCIRLMIHLHKEMELGRGDGEVADAIRDEMDMPCRSLEPWQTEILDGLSAALYDSTEINNVMKERFERKEEALKIYNDMPIG